MFIMVELVNEQNNFAISIASTKLNASKSRLTVTVTTSFLKLDKTQQSCNDEFVPHPKTMVFRQSFT